MNAGELDKRVAILDESEQRTSDGDRITTDVIVSEVWAKVRDLSGKEVFAAKQAGYSVSKTVTIRYRDGITADLRVRLPGGAVTRIVWIEEIGRRQYLRLHCEETQHG